MEEVFRKYQHNPPHLFRSMGKYFITGATYQKRPLLQSDAAKEKTVEYMFKSFEHFGWEIEDWVLLNNHYHVMTQAPVDATTLSRVMNNFHKFSAIWIRKNLKDLEFGDEVADRLTKSTYSKTELTQSTHSIATKIWYNYWDTCITYESSYFARINYIWFNPVKHGYVDDAAQWKFGSFYRRAQEQRKHVEEVMEKYPCDRIKIEDDY